MKFLFALLLIFPISLCAKPVNVLFIPPTSLGYWQHLAEPMPTIAKQLGLNLVIAPAVVETDSYYGLIDDITNAEIKPDWVIWTHRLDDPRVFLELLEKNNIKSIDITYDYQSGELKKIGYPQQKYKHWQAQVLNDGFGAGKTIANELVGAVSKNNLTAKVRMVGITGNRARYTINKSLQDLPQAMSDQKNLEFLQMVSTKWQRENAAVVTQRLFRRFQHFDAVLAGSTSLALGILDQLKTMSFDTLNKPLIASLGWSEEVFNEIKNNNIEFSMGANHLNGIWALVLIHDVESNIPIPAQPEYTLLSAPFVKATAENLDKIRPFFQVEHWQNIDIKRYSKKYNKSLKYYNFDFNLLLTD